MYASFALIMPIFTTGFGLSPVLVGWALMFPRLLDAVADPIIGHLSDDTHTKWGRRKPFLFVTSITGALLIVSLWWLPRDASQTFQFIFLVSISTLLFLSWGTFSMNHMALGYELSDDYHLRTKVMAVRTFYHASAAMAGGWLYWLAQRPYFGNEITGIRVLAIGLAIMTIGAAFTTIFCCEERFKNANRRHVNLFQAIKATLQIRAYVVLIIMRIVSTLGASLYGAVGFYITAYYICQNDKSLASSLSGISGMVGFVITGVMMFAATKVSRIVGKRKGIIWGAAIGFGSSITLPFFVLPGQPYIYLAHGLFFSILGGAFGVFSSAVMPDICDIDELKSGERREGLFSAVNSFINKVEHSLVALLGGYLVTFAGFDAHKAAQKIQQAPEVLDNMRYLGFTALIFFAGISLILAFYFPITESIMADVRAKLDERRKAHPIS